MSTASALLPPASYRLHIDRVDGLRMEGWALDPLAPGQERLDLWVGDQRQAAAIRRLPRADVSAALGVQADLGWELLLPVEIWAAAARGRVALSLSVNGVLMPGHLPWPEAQDLPRWVAQRLMEASEPQRQHWRPYVEAHLRACQDVARSAERNALGRRVPVGRLEGLRGQHVVGWLADLAEARHEIDFRSDAGGVACQVLRVSRQDVAPTILWPEEHIGLDIEIPGTLWRQTPPDADLGGQVLVDGQPWGERVVLRRDDLISSFEAAGAHAEAGQRVAAGLLALEHVVHAGLWAALSASQQAQARRLAESAGQAAWLQNALGETALPGAPVSLKAHAPQGRLGRWLQKESLARWAWRWLSWLRRHPGQRERAERTEIALTHALGLFDAEHYREQVPDDLRGGCSAIAHYVVQGDARSLVPHPLFDPRHYTGQLPGRQHPGINRLLHYGLVGRFQGLSSCAWFDTGHYLDCYPDVGRSREDALRHFISKGWQERREACRGFVPDSVHRQPLLQRLARETSPLRADPVLRYLLDGLPAHAPLPEQGHLPWRVTTELDGRDYLDLGPWRALPPRAAQPAGLDVIIPVYAGAQESLRCVWSALTAPCAEAFELVVIDDASPEPALSRMLRQLADLGLISLRVNERNLGFVRSVNLGMALHPDRDVVLLNADAQVHGNWLDRLLGHARAGERVASVTPLSNNATIFSYPRTLHNNSEADALKAAELDRLAAAQNAGLAVEVPTGMGFCMLLRRACLQAIGLFDAERFGRGYGEENDWCLRATAAGWHHLAAPDVFVLHQGSVSFRAEAEDRARAALALLRERFPDYQRRIDDWIAADPLAVARARLDLARLAQAAGPRRLVAMISHDRGGGTAKHEGEVAERLRAQGLEIVQIRPSAQAGCVKIVAPWAGEFPNLLALPIRSPSGAAAGAAVAVGLGEVLAALPVESVQVHHLADFSAALRQTLAPLCRAAGLAIEVTLHDYHLLCPRINLVGGSGVYCGEPEAQGCNRCLQAQPVPEPDVEEIGRWRREHAALLQASARVLAPDEDVARRFARYWPALGVQVVPHEAPFEPDRRQWQAGGAIGKVLVVGALSEIKGLSVVRGLAAEARARGAGLAITLLGHSSDDAGLRAAGVQVLGHYDDGLLQARIAELAPDLIWLPSVWPETYCYVLSAALRSGCRVAVFDIGAQARRLRALGLADWILPLAWAHRADLLLQAFTNGAPGQRSAQALGAQAQS